MGDYLDNVYVRSQCKGLKYNATGLPDTVVDGWILEEEAYVNSRVGNRYKVPALIGPSPNTFNLLRGIVVRFIKDRVLEFNEVKNSESRAEQGTEFSRNELAENRLKLIESGGMNLADAEALDDGESASASGFAADNNEEHVFKKNDPRISSSLQW